MNKHGLTGLLSDLAGSRVTVIEGGFRVKETDRHFVDVMLMPVNWRVTTTRKDRPVVLDRYWCYAGTGPSSLVTAVVAVRHWDGSDGSEPVGWNRNGQTGEWRRPPRSVLPA